MTEAAQSIRIKLMTEDDVREIMGMTLQSLRNHRSRNYDHPPHVKIGSMTYYPKIEFETWMEKRLSSNTRRLAR